MTQTTLHIGFIGFGLIGGSIARVLKAKHPDYIITAYSRSQAPLLAAKEDGNIDFITTDISAESFGHCDYIFLCTPVEYSSMYLSKLKPVILDTCIITDVGSVKGYIHQAVAELGMEDCFIGGHPMAGSEKTGYANSSALLLENAYYAVTPTSKTSSAQLENYVALVRDTGAVPVVLDYKKHDYSVAGISHLPHLIAGSLVNLIADKDSPDETMKRLAAGGFKDITRIASSSPEMWEQICMTNTDAILSLLSDYIASLEDIRKNLQEHHQNYVYQLFDKSREYRNSITDVAKGPVTPLYRIHCDLEDTNGALAKVATLLANNEISIKNIGIIHNREFENGALSIEFYSNEALQYAIAVLQNNHYTIY